MILPTITSIAYDSFLAIPADLRSASLALGTTRWQTIRHILLPAASHRPPDRRGPGHDAGGR